MNDAQNPDRPNDAVSDRLVAYLDGETNSAEQEAMERELANDPSLLEQLQSYQRTWHLLDQLPTAQPEIDFTRTTLAMATQSAAESDPHGPWKIRWTWWMVPCLAAGFGFLSVWSWVQTRHRQTLEDIPVARNMEMYRYAESVEFLEELHAAALFAEEDSE